MTAEKTTGYTVNYEDFRPDPGQLSRNLEILSGAKCTVPVSREEYERRMRAMYRDGQISYGDFRDNMIYYEYVIACAADSVLHPVDPSPELPLWGLGTWTTPEGDLESINRRLAHPRIMANCAE